MNSYDDDQLKLITSIENDDIGTAIEICTTRFDKKFLQPVGVLRVTIVQLAAWQGNIELLQLLYENGADINATDKIGRCALFHAAHHGNCEVVNWLLEHGASTENRVGVDSCYKNTRSPSNLCFIGQNLPTPECWGRTPMHQAVKNNHAAVVKILVEAGADVNAEDERGITPLLLAGTAIVKEDFNEISKFNDIVEILVAAKASTNVIDPNTGTTVLHTATSLGSCSATKRLLNGGAWPLYQCKGTGSTPLHLAASTGNPEALSILLESIPSCDIDIRDNINRTPLHRAAYQGHHDCVRILIDHGGNLGAETNTGITVIDAIFAHIPTPVLFLNDILSSRVKMSSVESSVENSQITIDFNVLAPKGELQMGVVTSLIAAASNVEQLTILQHPLVETFLWLKWSKLRVFFFSLVFVHALLVFSLSGYSITILQYETDCGLLRRILSSCSCVLFLHNVVQVLMVPRYYLRQYETWLSFTCAAISLTISMGNAYRSEITASSGEKELHDARQPLQWMLHSISLAILLAWMQMMLLIGRLPMCGYYALMFSTVLKNILKVLLAFVCLIVGFAFSFAVLFHGNDQFRNSWRAVVKTVVMMMGEYEYGALFSDEKNGSSFLPATSRVVFLAFVMLASIVLMNLMIGLAVNDIQGLEKEGHIRQLLKQAEFVAHLERLVLTSHRIFRRNWLHPRLARLLDSRRGIPTKITFCYHERYFHESSLGVPARLREALFLLALGNSRDTESRRENNNGDDNVELKALLEEVLLQLRVPYYPSAMRKFSVPYNARTQTGQRKIANQ
ncbi:transient receptor potential channel pyrexia-like isoform X1 [Bombus vosnesenskii]|uniref:Transient receptor potential channel pyrexia-like isoform X1 n=1 Tax=Bombus vosnesenskii TaxID=207650 RepID=A0A6J3LEE3_9HYME|nr:transient receptor potential channel pyrexia-like isoform X1 [Bombus vosnesenskii]XP_050477556.1 transient receptor potential channel pyrexia-like isoform X1 [Bombus huntii]